MSENPFQLLFQAYTKVSASVQTHLSNFINLPQAKTQNPLLFFSPQTQPTSDSRLLQSAPILEKGTSSGPTTKEELGRSTWTFLHTLAAQYPDKPTRQQKKDVKDLMGILSRMYPCQECADHFKEILRSNPVEVGSHEEFSQWLCHVHNVVNRSLGKRIFPCERVDARWGKLDCEQRRCDLLGSSMDLDFEIKHHT